MTRENSSQSTPTQPKLIANRNMTDHDQMVASGLIMVVSAMYVGYYMINTDTCFDEGYTRTTKQSALCPVQ